MNKFLIFALLFSSSAFAEYNPLQGGYEAIYKKDNVYFAYKKYETNKYTLKCFVGGKVANPYINKTHSWNDLGVFNTYIATSAQVLQCQKEINTNKGNNYDH